MEPSAPAQVLHSGILDSLGQEIIDGQLAPGSALTLAQIEERFDISRTVAREVMRSLEACGLTESRRRVGIVVRPAEHWNVLDPLVVAWRLNGPGRSEQLRALTQLRAGVEPLAAAGAAHHASDAQRARLLELARVLAQFQDVPAGTQFHAADTEFHTLLLAASGNDLFAALAKILAATLTARVSHGQFPATPRKAALDSHLAVAQAIVAGDADTAFAVMVAMLTELRADLFPSS